MTDEPVDRHYVHEGSGDQFNAEHVHGNVYIWRHTREIVAAHALDGEGVSRMLDVYVWTASARQAAEILRDRHSVVLTAPPGSGRWSTAVAAIDHAGVSPHRIDFDPEDARRDLPAETGCGYIVDIDEETLKENPAIGEILAEHGTRLARIGAFLVVTATADVWRQLQGRTSFEDVALSPPSSTEIFQKHLARVYPAEIPHWAWDSRITGILADASPADAARLATLVHDVVSARSEDPVGDTLDAYNNWSAHLTAWFGKNSDPYHRALLIAAAALGEARTETVFGAATLLANLVSLEQEPGGGLAGNGVTGLIGTIEAVETGNGRIRLRRAAYTDSVLDLVWHERPHLRAELRRWLTELPGAPSLNDPATENAGYCLIGLAIRHGDDALIRNAASSWANGGQADLAAVALTETALSPSTGRAVRRQMYSWADHATTSLSLRLTIANVCGGPFGKNYPRNAITRLRRLAIRGGPEMWDPVAFAFTELSREPHLRVLVLREVIRWATEDDRLRDPGIRAFLSLTSALAERTHDLDGEVQHGLLVSGWRAALRDPKYAGASHQGCAAWLEAVAQDRAPRGTVLTILAETCQNSRDIGTLCTIATKWSRDSAEPTPVSRDDVLFAFLRQIGDRDPLTPGLSPTQIRPETEEDDQ